ncbi:MAG: NAD(P)H-hydrate epimerase [Elusimicrobia bacterium RIFOXYB2_FULL_62_6]|nr:MAG: NAD(P)H-hydrate epimerase [Elusimicrobia bacterium RIFOXYB2_FULL_62_6]
MSKIPQIKEYGGLPVVTAEKMKYLDKKASADHGVPEMQLMENAGKAVALETLRIAAEELGSAPGNLKAAVCSGKGNNGGDGLVAARYLKEAGADAQVFILEPKDTGYGELGVRNLEKAKSAGVKVTLVTKENIEGLAEEFAKAGVLLDALLGISAVGKPTGPVRRGIQLMNKSGKPIIAVDIPSGLSPDTGHHSGVFVTARHTLTLGFAKTGLMALHAQKNTGAIKVLDIGYPEEVTAEARRE